MSKEQNPFAARREAEVKAVIKANTSLKGLWFAKHGGWSTEESAQFTEFRSRKVILGEAEKKETNSETKKSDKK